MEPGMSIEIALEAARRVLPDPFHLPSQLDAFFASPEARRLLESDRFTAESLLAFVEAGGDHALVNVAVILLSRLDQGAAYPELLKILRNADKPTAEAFDTGLWLMDMPESQIAEDLAALVQSTGNPNPLLLLQRDVAASIKEPLRRLIEGDNPITSLYAMYCYRYALDPLDRPFLVKCSRGKAGSELAAIAGLYLLELGSTEGHAGILAGLESPDSTVREATYFELCKHLPKGVLEQVGYDPQDTTSDRSAKAAALVASLAKRDLEDDG